MVALCADSARRRAESDTFGRQERFGVALAEGGEGGELLDYGSSEVLQSGGGVDVKFFDGVVVGKIVAGEGLEIVGELFDAPGFHSDTCGEAVASEACEVR